MDQVIKDISNAIEALSPSGQKAEIKLYAAGANNHVYKVSFPGTADAPPSHLSSSTPPLSSSGSPSSSTSSSPSTLPSSPSTSDTTNRNPARPDHTTELILRVPAAGKEKMAYGAIAAEEVKQRFRIFAPSGCAAKLRDVELPHGAVMCEYVTGRPAQYPQDLSLVIRSLAALHSCGKDINANRAKEWINWDWMMKIVDQRMAVVDDCGLSEGSVKLIKEIVARLKRVYTEDVYKYEQDPQTPIVPILKDANLGNFIVRKEANGETAVVVDLEGDFYGLAITDVGHASLYSATLWEYDNIAMLPAEKILALYEEYYGWLTQEEHGWSKDNMDQARPPSPVLLGYRLSTLCRCLTWMLNLIYLTGKGEVTVPAEKLAKAKLILDEDELLLARDSEVEIARLLA